MKKQEPPEEETPRNTILRLVSWVAYQLIVWAILIYSYNRNYRPGALIGVGLSALGIVYGTWYMVRRRS